MYRDCWNTLSQHVLWTHKVCILIMETRFHVYIIMFYHLQLLNFFCHNCLITHRSLDEVGWKKYFTCCSVAPRKNCKYFSLKYHTANQLWPNVSTEDVTLKYNVLLQSLISSGKYNTKKILSYACLFINNHNWDTPHFQLAIGSVGGKIKCYYFKLRISSPENGKTTESLHQEKIYI